MLNIIGIGPGGKGSMTFDAVEALKKSDIIVGYKPYLDYVSEFIKGKETFTTGMKGEVLRCNAAIDFALEGREVSIISTGDSGLYGMAGLVLELIGDRDIDVNIIPGVSAVFSAASELGAPLMMDTALISLSDLMVPYEDIKKRVDLAAKGDFVIALYNPKSKGRPNYLEEAIKIISNYREDSTPIGIVKNSGREGTKIIFTNLKDIDFEVVDMMTIVIIGNSTTHILNNRMVTKRGYNLWFGYLVVPTK